MQVKLHHKAHPPVNYLGGTDYRLQLVVAERLGLGHLYPRRQPLLHFPQGFIGQQLPAIHPQNHVGADVLNGLECGDGPPESRPILGVLDAHFRIFPRRPYHLGAQQRRRQLQHFPRNRPALMQFPHQIGLRNPYLVKGHLALLILGQGRQRRMGHPGTGGVHQQQGQAGIVGSSRSRAADHQTLAGGVKIVHKVFAAAQYEIPAVNGSRSLHRFGQIAGVGFGKSPGQNQFPPTDRRQQPPPLFRRPVPRQGQGRHGGGMERRRGNRPPHFLQDDAQVGQGQPLAAVLLRQG